MLKYLLYFIIFGLIGWAIDTASRSYSAGKYAPGTYYRYFSPIFGIGGIALLLVYRYAPVDFVGHVIIGGILSTLIELIGGIFCRHCLKTDLWDYSRNRFHYRGYIDLEHTICWFILAAILRAVFPFLP